MITARHIVLNFMISGFLVLFFPAQPIIDGPVQAGALKIIPGTGYLKDHQSVQQEIFNSTPPFPHGAIHHSLGCFAFQPKVAMRFVIIVLSWSERSHEGAPVNSLFIMG